MAAILCTLCGWPIGYETPFFQELGADRYVHALCLYKAEAEGKAKVKGK